MQCIAPTTGNGFLSAVLNYVDCQAQTLGSTAYQTLSAPGAPLSLAITSLLTLFIAIYGIKFLIGHVPRANDLIHNAAMVGIVLLVASSWTAYRVILYETVMAGPAELVGVIGGATALPGTDGSMISRLQSVDDAIVSFTLLGSGRFDLAATQIQPRSPNQSAPQTRYVPISDDLALGAARIAYLVNTIGTLGLVRATGGLLLALGPLFAGFLLFEVTRSIFSGWLRMLFATALAALGVSVILALQLGLVEPWLADVLAKRTARFATPAAPLELLAITLSFAFIGIGFIVFAVRIAFVINIPQVFTHSTNYSLPNLGQQLRALAMGNDHSRPSLEVAQERTRAALIAESLATKPSRARANEISGSSQLRRAVDDSRTSGIAREENNVLFEPVGQSFRRSKPRVSATALKRSLNA
jgi:type IV secretion system protein VirB6